MAWDSETYQHQEWLGLLQPVGLVVSPVALNQAQVNLDRSRLVELQQKLNSVSLKDFKHFSQEILNWLERKSNQQNIPRISDGVIYRILDKLIILSGERLSYRSLDVEQIGSVYEAIMGYDIKIATGKSLAIKPLDIIIDIEEILALKAPERIKKIQEKEIKLSATEIAAIKPAKTVEEIAAAIEKRISKRTPNLLPIGGIYLQPGEERRKSGSHYTPRKLTQPLVEKTLQPLLEKLTPTSEKILELKVCDLAMGSGAFLVETCRQLGDKLVECWQKEGKNIENDAQLAARRLIAQRCLYGVDKNPFAVNLGKLSLWLLNLSENKPFTFLDHSLKSGDSLVGIERKEIDRFGEIYSEDMALYHLLKPEIETAITYRNKIGETDTNSREETEEKIEQLERVNEAIKETKLVGDIITAAFFQEKTAKLRQEKRKNYAIRVNEWKENKKGEIENLAKENPLGTFNWEIEFPEVFNRENPGFDGIVGNPPFGGKNNIINGNPEGYLDWLKEAYPESHGNADLCAYFFRRAFSLLRQNGTMGLIATNTISQGDTRNTGLRYICENGGTIYHAQKRLKWPGLAAVVVSVVNIYKGEYQKEKYLDGYRVDKITAFLFHAGGNDNPRVLVANENKSFIGSYVLGMGFTFDDSNPDASPISLMNELIAKNPKNSEVIFPYIGGEEVNSSPIHAHHRYVINFGDMSEDDVRYNYPDLMAIVEEKVKPQRLKLGNNSMALRRKIRWWLWGGYTPALYKAISPLNRVLVIPRVSQTAAFTFLPNKIVYSEQLVVFALSQYSSFTLLQSQIHEIWARFFASSMKDDLRYTPSDCFETFPFPKNWETNPNLETIGETYYQYRAELMIKNKEGLTQTYNRFHNPYENNPEILQLRNLHNQLDKTVLKAYGWENIDTTCGFALDYLEIENQTLPEETQTRINRGNLFFTTADEAMDFDQILRTGKKKLPWKYRFSNLIQEEILAKLLELNQQRYELEIIGGKQGKKKTKKKG